LESTPVHGTGGMLCVFSLLPLLVGTHPTAMVRVRAAIVGEAMLAPTIVHARVEI